MTVSTEVFVVIIFFVALPIYLILFRSTHLPGNKYFLGAFLCIFASNIFTVSEDWAYHSLFNVFEHISITFGAFLTLAAIRQLINERVRSQRKSDQ